MIRAVLFDLDGTLLPHDFDRFFARYLDRLRRWYATSLGTEFTAEAIMAAAARMFANDGTRTNAEVFTSDWAARVGHREQVLLDVYASFVTHEGAGLGAGIEADPAARRAVEECRAAGARVALATNPVFVRAFIDLRVRWAGLEPDQFDLVTCADRMHFCKPRPEYYGEAAEILGVAPGECLMVGNDVPMDLVPAARVGMATCLVTNAHTVRGKTPFEPDHACALAEVPSLLARS